MKIILTFVFCLFFLISIGDDKKPLAVTATASVSCTIVHPVVVSLSNDTLKVSTENDVRYFIDSTKTVHFE